MHTMERIMQIVITDCLVQGDFNVSHETQKNSVHISRIEEECIIRFRIET